MNPLYNILRDMIGEVGPVTLERYMELVLHHPDYGYYRHNNPLGAEGDFITAPEISQMFGEMIGLWCFEVWGLMGKPDPFALLELGPGRGTLMQDILRATSRQETFQKALRLHILESNATLRAMQHDKLASFKPVYVNGLEALPPMPTIILANEFFDTIPMRQFVRTETGWHERLVDNSAGRLMFVDGPVQAKPPNGEAWPDWKAGSFYEVSPQSLAMVERLAAHVVRFGGAGLIADYGYAVPAGANTLDAVSRHQFVDPLENPGTADVTADVDFSALSRAAERSGTYVAGPTGQGAFLQALGIDVRAAQLLRNATEELASTIHADLKRLTDPSHMGTLFKAMAFMAPAIKDVPGFL